LRGHRGPVFALIASNDGSKIISGSRDKSIKVWDITDKKATQTFGIIDGHRGAVRSLVMSMDGRFIYSGSDDKSIIVWNSKTGDIVEKISGHKGKVLELELAHDGKRIISNSKDKRVKTWRLHESKGIMADLKQ
jgi:WD40 repeat protein